MYKSHLKARRGASQGGTPLAEIDSTSVESAWSVTPSTRRINDKTARYCTHAVGVASGLWRCSQQRSRQGAELEQRISRRPPASTVHGIEEALSCTRTLPSA